MSAQHAEELQKKSDAFASALVESAARATPVHPFDVPHGVLPATRKAPARTTNMTARDLDVTPPPVVLSPSPTPVSRTPPPAKLVSTATRASVIPPPSRASVPSTLTRAPQVLAATPAPAPVLPAPTPPRVPQVSAVTPAPAPVLPATTSARVPQILAATPASAAVLPAATPARVPQVLAATTAPAPVVAAPTPARAPQVFAATTAPAPVVPAAPPARVAEVFATTPAPVVLVPPPSATVGDLADEIAAEEIAIESYDLESPRPNPFAAVAGILRGMPKRGVGVAAISALSVVLLGLLVAKGVGLGGQAHSPRAATKAMALPAPRPSPSPIVPASTVSALSFSRPAPVSAPVAQEAHPQRLSMPNGSVNHTEPRPAKRVVLQRRVIAAAAPRASAGTPPAGDSDRVEKARRSYREGNERLLLGDATVAVGAYQEAIRLNPKDPAAYRGLGLARAQEGKRAEAIRYLRLYLKRAPRARDHDLISERIALLEKQL